ncbi:DEAD H (Asp-Glu-Ala-Asp His) box helicase 11 [Sparganum proliferum]
MEEFENDSVGDELLLAALDRTALPTQTSSPNSTAVCLPEYQPPTRSNFPSFPYSTPYPQQISLMRTVYSCLASAKCAVIESPTGTGKSLSLLASCLHWLLDHNEAIGSHLALLHKDLQATVNCTSSGPDWVQAYAQRRERRLALNRAIEPLESQQSALSKVNKLIEEYSSISTAKYERTFFQIARDYASRFPDSLLPDGERRGRGMKPLSAEEKTDEEEDKFLVTSSLPEVSIPEEKEEEGTTDTRVLQIIYCSRTHSQLGQVLTELKKMPSLADRISVVTLASRHLLCVNESVYSLKSVNLVRDACLDLIGGPKSKNCVFRAKARVDALSELLIGARVSAHEATSALRSNGREEMRKCDIEEAVAAAGCPYYANRAALPFAQLVLAPYQTVLVPGLRQTAGLGTKGSLRDAVLIFDEAHNLLDAVAASFSASVSHADLTSSGRLLEAYMDRYRSRLSALALLHLRQLKQVAAAAAASISGESQGLASQRRYCLDAQKRNRASADAKETVYTISDWLLVTGIDHISLDRLVEYLRQGHCLQKIIGFGKWFGSVRSRPRTKPTSTVVSLSLSACLEKLTRGPSRMEKEEDENPQSLTKKRKVETAQAVEVTQKSDLESCGPGLIALLSFLEALAQSESDGRVIVSPLQGTGTNLQSDSDCPPDGCLRFIILNPGRYLQDIVRDARSVLLAGGTMKPFEEFLEQVFRPAGKGDADVVLFSCDHVINSEQQLAIYSLPESPKGLSWDFTFKNRTNPSLMSACGDFIRELCKVTPGGLTVFFPSFDYLGTIWTHWKTTGLLQHLQAIKKLFREPRQSTALSQVLQGYAAAATSKSGACILAVIGGKLSEGINFNDDLARAVVIVGLPYPNVNSVTLREKINFLNRNFSTPSATTLRPQEVGVNASRSDESARLTPGQLLCESICMRSVNQAIGRSVRHAKDYAAIFLLDRRFSRKQVLNGLPVWAQPALVQPPPDNLSNLLTQLKEFFLRNKSLANR